MKPGLLSFAFIIFVTLGKGQAGKGTADEWRAVLLRKDGKQVPFLLQRKMQRGKTVLYVLNAEERIKITDVNLAGDSIFFSMPSFETSFRLKKETNGNLSGLFIKSTSGATQYWGFYAWAYKTDRFINNSDGAHVDISGKWDVSITRANGGVRKATAVFVQKGKKLTGSFLTPAADYRYLDGTITGDSLFLSGFDGDNIHLFEARIDNADNITGGMFFNGYTAKETWTAQKNNEAVLPEISDATRLRVGDSTLDFTFNDLDGRPVSIKDEKYKNKIVIIQLMGSWCANCLDETKFLSDYYKRDRPKNVEIIGLAYELTTDSARSRKSVTRFQKLFKVDYPLLITGVSAGDERKTEKTLPELTPIRSFPTTIFINKKGKVSEIHTNFYGPASGEYFEASKKLFYQTVNRLLKERR
jgi:thiol-disulfide isomerase/thioredoxin